MPLTTGFYCNRLGFQPERNSHICFFAARSEHPRLNGDLSHVMLDHFTFAREVVRGIDRLQFTA